MADLLLAAGHEAAVADDLSRGRRENALEGAAFYEADVRSGCGEVFEGFGPEAVCRQAAQVDVRRSFAEPDLDAAVNIIGTIRLLQNCVRYGVERFVFASTAASTRCRSSCSPLAGAHDVIEGLQTGLHGYETKPFSPDGLVARVRAVLWPLRDRAYPQAGAS